MSFQEKIWHKNYAPGTSKEIGPSPYKNLAEFIRSASANYKKKKAFVTCMPNGMNGSLSFEKVDLLSDAFAIYLRESLKLKEGDRVAIQMPNCLSYPIAAFGVLKAGCVLVNTNPLYTSSEMKHQFKDAEVKTLVIINMFCDKLEEVLKDYPIDNIIISRVSGFFPSLVGKVIDVIQKYWNQQIPKHNLKASTFEDSVKWGLKNLDKQRLDSYIANINQDSIAVLQYTGGTTGVSKGAMLSHKNLMANVSQVLELIKSHVSKGEECILTALPLYHIFAFSVNLLGFYYLGAKNILIPSPRPLLNLKRAFENYPVTWLTAVNTLLNGLCNEIWFTESPPKKLRATAAGGMALQAAVAERWEAVTKTPVIEGYGLTEASPAISFNPLGGLVKRDSIGIPIPSTDVKCMNEDGVEVMAGEAGEIWCKGPQVMLGYWNHEEETKTVLEDGWLKTGDIAVMDEDGYFKIVDRKKDMIVVSGFNVYPNEIEDCLAKLDKVMESAVIGVDDDKTTEAVKAFIVKKDSSLNEAEVIQHCKKYLTAYKVPKLIEFRKDLPKSPIGKILRKELRNG